MLRDPELARFEGRIETDRHGHIIMSPPPAAQHGGMQYRIGRILDDLMRRGRVLTECPISTADSVKAADVAWASFDRIRELGNRACFSKSPEICVEILSPGNTEAEISEKTALYFDAGAVEVWVCGLVGNMKFFVSADAPPMSISRLCPQFRARIDLKN